MFVCRSIGLPFAVAMALLVGSRSTWAQGDARAAPKQAPQTQQSPQASLAIEIRQLVEELQAARRSESNAEKQHREDVARVNRQIETLERQLKPTEEAVGDQRGQIATLEKEIAEHQAATASNREWIGKLSKPAGDAARRAEQRSTTSAADEPQSRAAAFAGTAKLLDDESQSRRATGLKDLCRLYSDDWQPARTVGLTNEQVILDGGQRSHHAWVYRLGLVSKAFVAEGGDTTGIWQRDAGSPWKLDTDEKTQAELRLLLDVAREQKAPKIVSVPVSVAPSAAEK